MSEHDEHTEIEVNGFWLWMAKNWQKAILQYLIPIFVFLGGVTYFEEIKDNMYYVWDMPKNGAIAIAKSDSTDIIHTNQLKQLHINLVKLESDVKLIKFAQTNTCQILESETDHYNYRGISFYTTNPHYLTGLRAPWIFITDTSSNLTIPYELKYNTRIDGYEYWDFTQRKKILLHPKY